MSFNNECPFCGEVGYDLLGLKSHLQFCDEFQSVPSIQTFYQGAAVAETDAEIVRRERDTALRDCNLWEGICDDKDRCIKTMRKDVSDALGERDVARKLAATNSGQFFLRENDVITEILAIMDTYHEQEARPEGIGTPGGLEHMGDVWSMFMNWEQILRPKTIHIPNTTAIQEGLQARMDDDENGTLTDNPYHPDLSASIDWYKAYNFVTHDDQ